MSLILALFGIAVFAAEPAKPKLSYDAAKALEYAKQYCDAGTNKCESKKYDKDGNYDCTHFMGHTLNAGGVKVKGSDEAHCKSDLVIRVSELRNWFDAATKKYSNVKHVDRKDTKAGNYAIILKDDSTPQHAVMLSEKAKDEEGKAYSHSSDVCGDVPVKMKKAEFYRID